MKRAVHLAGERGASRCGWLFVSVESDVSRVTCKACLKLLVTGMRLPEASPTAGAPPKLTPALWAASCRGGEQRCGTCDLCTWEKSANLWAGVSPWEKRHGLERLEAPRWPSVGAALADLVEWERTGRARPSSLGGMLRRIESGDISRRPAGEGLLLGKAGELVAVRQALEEAYPQGAHRLAQGVRMALLCVRLSSEGSCPTYAELTLELGEPEGELKALVRHGRLVVGQRLADRGLVPAQRAEAITAAPCAVRIG